jgi:hypothetical protein
MSFNSSEIINLKCEVSSCLRPGEGLEISDRLELRIHRSIRCLHKIDKRPMKGVHHVT